MNNCGNLEQTCPAKVASIKCSYSRENEYREMWEEDLNLIAKGALIVISLSVLGIIGIITTVFG